MKIVVVGANGFIGDALVGILRQSKPNAEIVGVVRTLPEDGGHSGIRYSTQLETADLLFYLAGVGGIPESFADPAATFAHTCRDSITAIDAARELGIGQFVFASTCAVYPHGPSAANEHGLLDLNSPYAKAKRTVEMYGLTSSELTGQGFKVARLANVYGPNQRRQLIQEVATRALSGGRVSLKSSGLEKRDFIHVTDVARALMTVATSAASATITNVGSGSPRTVRDVASRICDAFGATLEAPPVDPNAEHGQGDAYPSVSALFDLGFRPEMDFEIGLADTLEEIRKTT